MPTFSVNMVAPLISFASLPLECPSVFSRSLVELATLLMLTASLEAPSITCSSPTSMSETTSSWLSS